MVKDSARCVMSKQNLQSKIKYIIEQEKLANNSWRWIKDADEKTINELYDYWTQEEDVTL